MAFCFLFCYIYFYINVYIYESFIALIIYAFYIFPECCIIVYNFLSPAVILMSHL